MKKRLDNCLAAIYTDKSIEKFLLDCDIKALILEVIRYEQYAINAKCILLSKIVTLTKFNINSYDRNTHPLLSLCCSDSNLELVKLLIEKMGANINVSNSVQRTPIANAFYRHCVCTIKYLYKNGANLPYQENGKNIIFVLHREESLDALSDGKNIIFVPHREESLDAHSKNCSTRITNGGIKHIQLHTLNVPDNLKICDNIEKSEILYTLTENINNIIIKHCTTDVKAHSIETVIELLLDDILNIIISCPANVCSVFDWTKIIKLSTNKMIEILGRDFERITIRIVKVINRIIQFKYSYGEKYGILEEIKYHLES